MRTAAAKENCLVLDFAGNIERHGPVDNILPPLRRRKGGEVPMKECEDCIMLVPLIARTCRFCGFEFPIEDSSKLAEQASQSPILDLEQSHIRYEDIRSVFSVQQCPGQPDSIQIDYFDRDQKVASDWLNPLQTDYAGLAAEKWFVEYCEYFGRFQSIVDALDVAEQQAAAPEYIVVDESGRVPRVVDTGPPRRESFPAWMEG
jgi:DNA repair protein RadD